MTVLLRSESVEDEPFLRRVIIETAGENLGAALWPESMRAHLLEIQYTTRRESVLKNFPDARSYVLVVDGVSAGWLCVTDRPECIRVIEIMVLAEQRGKGVGTAVFNDLIAASERDGKRLRLGVDASNTRAIRLYERLGFRRTGGDDVQNEMEREVPGERHFRGNGN